MLGADLPFKQWSGGGSWGLIVREPIVSRPRDLHARGIYQWVQIYSCLQGLQWGYGMAVNKALHHMGVPSMTRLMLDLPAVLFSLHSFTLLLPLLVSQELSHWRIATHLNFLLSLGNFPLQSALPLRLT